MKMTETLTSSSHTAPMEDVIAKPTVVTSVVIPRSSTLGSDGKRDRRSFSKEESAKDGSKIRSLSPPLKRPRVTPKDDESRKRGQRMLGVVLGTLTKFKKRGEHKTEAEVKREELEKKLQKKLQDEKDELAASVQKEREERQKRVQLIRQEEERKTKAKLNTVWHQQKTHLANFLKTKTKPELCYLPAKLSEAQMSIISKQKEAVPELKVDVCLNSASEAKDISSGISQSPQCDAMVLDQEGSKRKKEEDMEVEREDSLEVTSKEDLNMADAIIPSLKLNSNEEDIDPSSEDPQSNQQ